MDGSNELMKVNLHNCTHIINFNLMFYQVTLIIEVPRSVRSMEQSYGKLANSVALPICPFDGLSECQHCYRLSD